jgi:hypothetical protein
MTDEPRKVFSARVPAWLLREVSASYGNVSEFTERALRTQLQLDRQTAAIERLVGDGDTEKGRRILDEMERQPGYAEMEARWTREEEEAKRELVRQTARRRRPKKS